MTHCACPVLVVVVVVVVFVGELKYLIHKKMCSLFFFTQS